MKKLSFLAIVLALIAIPVKAQFPGQKMDTVLHKYTFRTGALQSLGNIANNPQPVWEWNIDDSVIMRRTIQQANKKLPYDTVVVAFYKFRLRVTEKCWTMHYETENHGYTYDLIFYKIDGDVFFSGLTREPYGDDATKMKLYPISINISPEQTKGKRLSVNRS